MLRIATCPGCGREIATDVDETEDVRAAWCLNCGGTGDPNPTAIANTRFLLAIEAHEAKADLASGRASIRSLVLSLTPAAYEKGGLRIALSLAHAEPLHGRYGLGRGLGRSRPASPLPNGCTPPTVGFLPATPCV